MAQIIPNPWRAQGLAELPSGQAPDPTAVAKLLALCPLHAPTPLQDCPALAQHLGVVRVSLKDERHRMGLGSFKALGGAYAIAHDASLAVAQTGVPWSEALIGRGYVTASAGNHGLSVAAGTRIFGARAVIYLSHRVPEGFAARLREKGAEVVRAGETYEESMQAAEAAASNGQLSLLSDSSWPGYTTPPFLVMEGYTQMAQEIADQIETVPTHVFLQAGVGGLAAAIAGVLRQTWGAGPRMIIVEPEAAPALIESIKAERVVTTSGPLSQMGRLDCKTPSMLALADLARDADDFATITEDEAQRAVDQLGAMNMATTPSGAAGLAAALAGIGDLSADAHVLCIISEGPESG
jgi:diaminopropionate ammonia-lyase